VRYKVGVKLPRVLDARMFVALEAIEWAWIKVTQAWADKHGDDSLPTEPTITSWADSTHGPTSWHTRKGGLGGDGRAVDVRTKTLPRDQVEVFRAEVAQRITLLGFDVILEDFNGPNEHLHVELDGRADQ